MLTKCKTAGKCLIMESVLNLKELSHQPELRLGVFPTVTILQAITLLLVAKENSNRRPRYIASLRFYLLQFAKNREDRDISGFETRDIEAWMSRYKGAFSRRTWLSRLSPLFSFAVRRGWIASNPCDRVERVQVDITAPVILTPTQATNLMQVVSSTCRPYVILAMYAGIRPEEITRMEWSAINLETGTVKVDGKTRRRRIVQLEPKAAALLAGCPLKTGKVAPSTSTMRRCKARAVKALCLPKWPQDLLRHTFASYALALHKDAGKVATMMGNSSSVLLTHYHEPVSENDCAEFWKI